MSATELDLDSGWDDARWVTILDRIEHRDSNVGLRFWGPPLWLEVTMVGPDSDAWPAITDELTSWNWQSNTPCVELAGLVDEGVDDDRLLGVVVRYTIENLILNAVHEIGEWFRFDGRRPFPAHLAGSTLGDDAGNGAVSVHLDFGDHEARPVSDAVAPAPDDDKAHHVLNRLREVAAPSRFTYLPHTRISYGAGGPAIERSIAGSTATFGQSTWSTSTMNAVDADDVELIALATRDVHRALVSYEARSICGAFHVDGHRPWRLANPESARVALTVGTQSDHSAALSVSIVYSDDAASEAESYPPIACPPPCERDRIHRGEPDHAARTHGSLQGSCRSHAP